MNDVAVKNRVMRGIEISRQIVTLEKEFKEIRKELIAEARERKGEYVQTDGGGNTWKARGQDGAVAHITFPADRLRSKIDGVSKDWLKILDLVNGLCAPEVLFDPAQAFKPKQDFRILAPSMIGNSKAAKLIAICTSKSEPSLSFEVKENVDEIH